MTRPDSEDIRERALARADAGESVRLIAEALHISPSCVTKWKNLRRRSEALLPAISAVAGSLRQSDRPLGTVTEVLNRAWYQRTSGHTVKDIQKRGRHPIHKWMAATLDGTVEQTGAVFEAKFMLPWAFTAAASSYLLNRRRHWRSPAPNVTRSDGEH
ncbi:hypothetical protein ACVWXM_001356 [Bradyrhizobium sp. GM7.3]